MWRRVNHCFPHTSFILQQQTVWAGRGSQHHNRSNKLEGTLVHCGFWLQPWTVSTSVPSLCLWASQKDSLSKGPHFFVGSKTIQWAFSSPQTSPSCLPPSTHTKLECQWVGAQSWSLLLWGAVEASHHNRSDVQYPILNCPGPCACRVPQGAWLLHLKKWME